MCDVLISNILKRKDKQQRKAQELNRKKGKEFNIYFIDYEKTIRPKDLNKSRPHMNERTTCIFASNFISEILNEMQRQCILRSPSGEFDAFDESAEYKSTGSDINHLKLIHKMNSDKFAYSNNLNINLIRNNFEYLIENVSGEVDLLIISEKKRDESFPKSQFLVKNDPFRIDRNMYEGGILLYAREGILASFLLIEPIPSLCFFIVLNLCKRKWLISCSYNPQKKYFETY